MTQTKKSEKTSNQNLKKEADILKGREQEVQVIEKNISIKTIECEEAKKELEKAKEAFKRLQNKLNDFKEHYKKLTGDSFVRHQYC